MVGVGEEAYRREIEAACREGGVRCEFLGALDDAALARVYASATVYAQASRTLPQSVEGFGISFLEASFHGCPVAAYRSGGVEEAVGDGETGLLVPEGDCPRWRQPWGGCSETRRCARGWARRGGSLRAGSVGKNPRGRWSRRPWPTQPG